MDKIGFGGGCHWCTEAVFQHLRGVHTVEQGWIAPRGDEEALSEAVLVHFDPTAIELAVLIEVHLRTHNSTANHSMRHKYRSAVYTFSDAQRAVSDAILADLQADFEQPLVTRSYPFGAFAASPERFRNYYNKGAQKPFCKTYIQPKLSLLMTRFARHAKTG